MTETATSPSQTEGGKKVHWAKTPEGRLRLSEAQKISWRKRRLGRLKVKPRFVSDEKRKTLLMEWERSGLSARMFAAKRGIKDSDLYTWRALSKRKLKTREARENGNNAHANAIVRVGRTESTEQEQIDTDAQYQSQITYAVGHCKGWLGVYAESIGVPTRIFARRVGELLFRTTHG